MKDSSRLHCHGFDQQMASAAVLPAMNGDKSLHPFFAARTVRHTTDIATSGDESINEPDNGASVEPQAKKKRKPRSSVKNDGKTQKTLQELVNPVHGEPEEGLTAVEVQDGQNKRRRTSETEYVNVDGTASRRSPNSVNGPFASRRLASPQVVVPYSSPLPTTTKHEHPKDSATPPKKMLRLRAGGKFSSPVNKKTQEDAPGVQLPKRRGRPRMSKDAVTEKHLLVAINYAIDSDLGRRIDSILVGKERVRPKAKMTPKKQRMPRGQHPTKPTHPLFLGKPKAAPALDKDSPRKASAVTPGKLRRQASCKNARRPPIEHADVWTSSLLKDRLMVKHPGAKESSWPTKETVHVRSLDDIDHAARSDSRKARTAQQRKRKHPSRFLSPDLTILSSYTSKLRPEEGGRLRRDGFRDPHPSLLVPERLLIAGEQLADQVRSQLRAEMTDSMLDELTTEPLASFHPALQRIYDNLPHSLTAFDEIRGDTVSWTQKYAPATAAEVLQPTSEINVLKEWLRSLTVTAVESTTKNDVKIMSKSIPRPRKKRKRKTDDLDDFLVESDEEVHDMDELTDPEDNSTRHGVRSIVQTASAGVKLSNAVLLSGAHGCGKTAAAYAVAKELGFKVFEISSSERRSGKDVQERVGDMTENHLVKHHGTDSGELSAAEEPSVNEEAFQRDLASGRQGKMMAFFKPKTTAKHKPPAKKAATKVKAEVLQALTKAARKPPKDQQQSLILLEEVDVLFKDDKDFWAAVLKLITTSKRPFIMTCNDEDLVPLQALSLHAILRLQRPPAELCVDYLLLIAAAEGHLVPRRAVEHLFSTKQHDLRASIMQLDFWCQMGIGDPRGGLGWIYQRYPPGSDVDDLGRKLRVVSRMPENASPGDQQPAQMDEERLRREYHDYDRHPLEFVWHHHQSVEGPGVPSLAEYAFISDAMSASDAFTGDLMAPLLDTTQKSMSQKSRSHYVEGMQLLQSDVESDYTGLRASIAAFMAVYGLHNADSAVPADIDDSSTCDTRRGDSGPPLTRKDMACFDPIAIPATSDLSGHSTLATSAFDGPIRGIALDLAPYVRSIVSYDLALAEQRNRLNDVVNGVKNTKQARKTRAARSALEGSQRCSTRKERWFVKPLDYDAVLATGGRDWPGLNFSAMGDAQSDVGAETPSSSMEVGAT